MAAGGDWRAQVVDELGVQAPGIVWHSHTNMPGTVPADVSTALNRHQPAPAGISAEEKSAWDQLDFFYKKGPGYANAMALRPQALYGLADSPVGLAAWILDHDDRSYKMIARALDGQADGLTPDDILDNITLYWLTNTAVSSAHLYWNHSITTKKGFFDVKGVVIPVAVSAYPSGNLYRAAQFARESISQAHSLQQASQRHSLRRVGTAAILFRGISRGFSDHCANQPKDFGARVVRADFPH